MAAAVHTTTAPAGDVCMQYEDGSTYQGPMVDGMRHGFGEFSCPSGFSFRGHFNQGAAEGEGEATYPNGSKYVGEWAADARHGFGELLVPSDGQQYAGMWRNDVIHGHGRWTYPDGSFFEGQFVDGRRVHGTLASADGGDVYRGAFGRTEARDGEGLQLLEGLWQYRGSFCLDARHGHGECRYLPTAANARDAGGRYVGDWAAGVRCGHGRMEWPSGEWYEGDWSDDVPHGFGTGTDAAGERYQGEWARGVRHGHGRCLYACGDKYDGQFQQHLPHGIGVMKYASGEVYQGEWHSGQRHGAGEALFADGVRFAGRFEHGEWLQGPADAHMSRLVAWPGDQGSVEEREVDVVAGSVVRWTIQARDAQGNRRLSGGDAFFVRVVGTAAPGGAQSSPTDDGALLVGRTDEHVVDLNDGTYQVCVRAPTVAGPCYGLMVELAQGGGCGEDRAPRAATSEHPGGMAPTAQDALDGDRRGAGHANTAVALAGSPYPLRVHPGPPCVRKTLVSGYERCVRAGQRACFVVQARDAHGNECKGADALRALPLEARITGGCSGAAVAHVHVTPRLSTGQYECSFVVPVQAVGHCRLELVVRPPRSAGRKEPAPVGAQEDSETPAADVEASAWTSGGCDSSSEKPAAHESVLRAPRGDEPDRVRRVAHHKGARGRAPPAEEQHLPGSPFALSVLPDPPQPQDIERVLSQSAAPRVEDQLAVWASRAHAAFIALDGSSQGWDARSQVERADDHGRGHASDHGGAHPGGGLSAAERAAIAEHPGVPVVERLEDLWRLSKLKTAQERWDAE